MCADTDRWAEPTDVADVDIVFSTRGPELTPLPDKIPDGSTWGPARWENLASNIFSGTIDIRGGALQLVPHDGIDPEKAWRHLQVVLGTFGTKHEHKIGGAAWLMSRWYQAAAWTTTCGQENYAGDPEMAQALHRHAAAKAAPPEGSNA